MSGVEVPLTRSEIQVKSTQGAKLIVRNEFLGGVDVGIFIEVD